MKKIMILILLMIITTVSFAGDVLILNNNKQFEGKIKRIKDCSVIFKVESHKYEIPATDIYSIQFEDSDNKVYTEYLEMLKKDPNLCMKGRLDAESLHGKKGGHFVLGFLFGPFAMIGTALSTPTPYTGKQTLANSNNKDSFNDLEYLNCYKKKVKGQLIGMEALGWSAFILLILIL